MFVGFGVEPATSVVVSVVDVAASVVVADLFVFDTRFVFAPGAVVVVVVCSGVKLEPDEFVKLVLLSSICRFF